MRIIYVLLSIIFFLSIGYFLFIYNKPTESYPTIDTSATTTNKNAITKASTSVISDPIKEGTSTSPLKNNFVSPLDNAGKRVTKKKFGQYITPKNSPVQPERFSGYHAGVDFEVFPSELNKVVEVHTVCAGKLLLKKYATGYGGVAVQSCKIDNQAITVIYGHLKLSSISKKTGQEIKAGEVIGILGANKSVETNGERKHLHLGFHRGTIVNIRGYTSAKSELINWLDPCLFICK